MSRHQEAERSGNTLQGQEFNIKIVQCTGIWGSCILRFSLYVLRTRTWSTFFPFRFFLSLPCPLSFFFQNTFRCTIRSSHAFQRQSSSSLLFLLLPSHHFHFFVPLFFHSIHSSLFFHVCKLHHAVDNRINLFLLDVFPCAPFFSFCFDAFPFFSVILRVCKMTFLHRSVPTVFFVFFVSGRPTYGG